MLNIIHLLALIRIDAQGDDTRVAGVIDAYAGWVVSRKGYVIDRSPPLLMVCLPDAGQTLESLHALMQEGGVHGFQMAAGVVQAVRSTDRVPRSPADFTERTIETLIELAGSAALQQIAVSPRLTSLIKLAVPHYAPWFEAGADPHASRSTRVRQRQVINGMNLPRYQGPIRICPPTPSR